MNQNPGGEDDPEHLALSALDRDDHEEALRILMNAYGNVIFRYCCTVTESRALAEEALQETFLQAHDGLDRFGRRSKLRTRLYSTARHRCLDLLKKERNLARRVETVPELPDAPDRRPGPYRSFTANEFSDVLHQCLQELSAEARSDSLEAELVLESVGTYQPMLFVADRPLPSPTGNLDEDAGAALELGARIESGRLVSVR